MGGQQVSYDTVELVHAAIPRDRAVPAKMIAERVGKCAQTVCTALDQLTAEGRVVETTGQKQHRRFIRNGSYSPAADLPPPPAPVVPRKPNRLQRLLVPTGDQVVPRTEPLPIITSPPDASSVLADILSAMRNLETEEQKWVLDMLAFYRERL